MITDEEVRLLYEKIQRMLDEHGEPDKERMSQLYVGRGPLMIQNKRLVSCERHMFVFNEYNVIPEFCFDCYKVVISPRNVLELFKLMMLFETIDLPKDYTRKTMVELRPEVSGTYKGLIYCMGLKDAKELFQIIQKEVSDNLSDEIDVTLKRGCSEYDIAFPGYGKVEQGTKAKKYKKKWKKYEALADERINFDNTQPSRKGTYNRPGFLIRQAHAMRFWLTYAATIGDLSYKKISGCELPPDPSIKRPVPFDPNS